MDKEKKIIDVKAIESQLAMEENLLNATAQWWQNETIRRVAMLNTELRIAENLEDVEYETIEKIEKIRSELKSLDKKSQWEQKTIKSFNIKKENFNKLKASLRLKEVARRINNLYKKKN